MAHGFVAYIDESGDPGVSGPPRGTARDGGQSHFLTIAAYVVRTRQDALLVSRRDAIREEIAPHAKKRDIHFAKLKHHQKARVSQLIASHPGRAIAVVINKFHLAQRERFLDNCHQLYWYACRLLIERISWLCDGSEPNPDRKGVQLVFSNRGGMSYSDFAAYMRNLREVYTEIRWRCFDQDCVKSYSHTQRAGLQFADCIARAVTEGLEPGPFGLIEPRYGLLIRPIAYRYRNRRTQSYGLKVLPDPPTGLSNEQNAYIEAFCE